MEIDKNLPLEIIENSLNDIIVITDKNGLIVWVNNFFTELTEYNISEVTGKKPGDFLQGEETNPETVKEMRNAIQNKKAFNVNVINYSKSGRKYWLNIKCNPYFNQETGELENFIAIERDITAELEKQQIKIDDLISELEGLKAKNQKLIESSYILSHDLKAPVNNFESLLSLLKQNIETEKVEVLISSEIGKMKKLINKSKEA